MPKFFDLMSGWSNPFARKGADSAAKFLTATTSGGDINAEALENPIAMADRYFKDSLWEMSNAFLQRQKAEEKRSFAGGRRGHSGIQPVAVDKMGFMNIPPMVDPRNLGGGR